MHWHADDMNKTCFKCGISKPLSQFYRHGMMSSGRIGKCKECTKADVRANRLKNIEKYREYDRNRSALPHRVKVFRDKTARKRSEPGVMAAHNAVARAIRSGALVRPDHCTRCMCQCAPQAHHDDYFKPLDVMWLCPVCHAARHAELGKLGKHSPRKPEIGGVADPKFKQIKE